MNTTLEPLFTIHNGAWQNDPAVPERAIDALESGQLLYIPDLGFDLQEAESRFLTPGRLQLRAKNASYNPSNGKVAGLAGADKETEAKEGVLGRLMSRYLHFGEELLAGLLGDYAHGLEAGRTSFRPVEIAGRPAGTLGDDDTLLHVDSFGSTPIHGRRIFRLFTNVNPDGEVRLWRVGEPFLDLAERFVPRLRAPLPGEATALRLLHLTRSRRSRYDHYMQRLQDYMRANARYQREVTQFRIEFAPGSTWLCFTDQVSHAALAGRGVLEQTWYLPVERMRTPERSPLKVLESMLHRTLV